MSPRSSHVTWIKSCHARDRHDHKLPCHTDMYVTHMLQCVAVSCSMLRYVAVWVAVCCSVGCSVLQCGLQYVAVRVAVCCSVGCSVLQCGLQCVAVSCSMLRYVAVWVAVCCSVGYSMKDHKLPCHTYMHVSHTCTYVSHTKASYGLTTLHRLLKIIGLFCRI